MKPRKAWRRVALGLTASALAFSALGYAPVSAHPVGDMQLVGGSRSNGAVGTTVAASGTGAVPNVSYDLLVGVINQAVADNRLGPCEEPFAGTIARGIESDAAGDIPVTRGRLPARFHNGQPIVSGRVFLCFSAQRALGRHITTSPVVFVVTKAHPGSSTGLQLAILAAVIVIGVVAVGYAFGRSRRSRSSRVAAEPLS